MKKSDIWWYTLGGVVLLAILYGVYQRARTKAPANTNYSTNFDTDFEAEEAERRLSTGLQTLIIDLSIKRNDEEITLDAKGLYVVKATGSLKIKINDRTSALLDMGEIRKIHADIERIYLTNPPQNGGYVEFLVAKEETDLEFFSSTTSSINTTSYCNYGVLNITGTDTESEPYYFTSNYTNVISKTVDIFVSTNPAYIRFVSTDSTKTLPQIYIPANTYYSVNAYTRGIRIQNAESGADTQVQVVYWW